MKYAVGVVHYREPGAIERLLTDLAHLDEPPVICFVVDNSGELDSGTLRDQFPGLDVVCIALGRNLGYAAAANVALRECSARSIPSMLLLTQDARVSQPTVCALRDGLEADERIAVVAPLLAFASKPEITFSRGGYLLADGRFNHHGALAPISSVVGQGTVDVDWVDGALLLIRVDAAADVGLIPEEYFLYVEDVDFGLLLRRRGWSIRVVTDVVGLQEPGNFTSYFRGRNLLYFLLKHRLEFRGHSIPLFVVKELLYAARRTRLSEFTWTARGIVDAFAGRMGPPPSSFLSR